ncbi:protein MIZU-KUSSEI 1-like protein [Cinnamomum micranthum f. kanehirae]|uniref:Protein MIZU-KUSSEI 1-like protein n=1 Tax=Cinnamomum micranthum f. kanehirae TaxID=337451 RepID=A0A443PMM4_9MAGN|nr:protein MIZU-KUSSEI 1-like protein [Cinnamomum micranthum f. kanehirae]
MSPELKRTTSKTSWKIVRSSTHRSVVAPTSSPANSPQSLIPKQVTTTPFPKQRKAFTLNTIVHSLLSMVSIPSSIIPTCGWLAVRPFAPSVGRRVIGTLFGRKHGHASLAIQLDPRSDPVLLLELAVSTSSLVREMALGMARIALECERGATATARVQLVQEPLWTMYCNGKQCGYAVSRTCGEPDWHVLRAVERVSVGAGVLPAEEKGRGQVMYMRSRFERVVGSKDSEAFYMLNLERNGGPELTIFLLRI